MLKFDREIFHALVWVLSIGAIFGHNPGASSAALALWLSYRIAEKYFHNSFFDDHRKELSQLRQDLTKIKAQQDQLNLKSAFGGSKP